jgi:hypothetical protein
MFVICKIPFRFTNGDVELTIGKSYKVIYEIGESYYITRDDGNRNWYEIRNFYNKNELRDNKLDKLLT